jgi:hypothetical protein
VANSVTAVSASNGRNSPKFVFSGLLPLPAELG